MGTTDKKTIMTIACIAAAFVIVFSLVTVIFAIVIGNDRDAEDFDEDENHRKTIESINGVWIASISNIDFPSSPDLSEEELKAELDSIVKTVSDAGLDTIFFQVRPSSDALYDSEIFPVSKYLSSDGELTVDALSYLIKSAKKKNIDVHAWINPLRVSVGGEIEDLPDGHPAKAHPEWCVKYADGNIYYNCGIPEVRQLVAEGIREIIENYDVCGIVFDDYFYPYPKYVTDVDGNKTVEVFEDSITYGEYGTDYDDIGDWRRENVNKLVKLSYDTVKEEDSKCYFGVSPFGIWKNGYGDDSGSATRGSQSYFDIYCDTLAWADGGYVDYIAPQIYWRTEESAASYTAVYDWWALMLESRDVPLLVSHAAYRYSDWEEPYGIITSQVEHSKKNEGYFGSIYYGYSEIVENTNGITDELKKLYSGK